MHHIVLNLIYFNLECCSFSSQSSIMVSRFTDVAADAQEGNCLYKYCKEHK